MQSRMFFGRFCEWLIVLAYKWRPLHFARAAKQVAMQPEKIVEIVRRVSSAPNKKTAIARLGISQSTFYSWQKKYSEGGAGAFGFMRRPWTKDEDVRLAELASRGLKLKEIAQEFPLRREKMLRGRLEKLGIQLLQRQREHRLAEGKKCSVCKAIVPLTNFYKAHYESLDGRMSLCKTCFNASQKRYRSANADKIKVRHRQYVERRKVEDLTGWKQKKVDYRRTARGAFLTLQKRCSSNPMRKGWMAISWEQFTAWYCSQEPACVYCGVSLEQFLSVRHLMAGSAKAAQTLTIDRCDSLKPYAEGNIVMCCYLCNYLKGFFFTAEEFGNIAREYVSPYYSSLLKTHE